MRLSTVILNVGDAAGLADVRRWYEDMLGLVVESEVQDHSVWYRVGPTLLGLHVGVPLVNPENVCLGVDVDNVDELFSSLRASGAQFDSEPTDKPWGARAVSTHDPLGHTVTLATPRRAS